jgi:hypothetical protein
MGFDFSTLVIRVMWLLEVLLRDRGLEGPGVVIHGVASDRLEYWGEVVVADFLRGMLASGLFPASDCLEASKGG